MGARSTHAILTLIAAVLVTFAMTSTAVAVKATDFLMSLRVTTGIEAPRLVAASTQINVTTPSFLSSILGATAEASYNDWTNTLTLKPELTIKDTSGRLRIRTIREIREATGSLAAARAGTIFHELSHAEWDFHLDNPMQDFDRALRAVIDRDLPGILQANALSTGKRKYAASELFAYYRQELAQTILNDVYEIKFASGLDPDTNACHQVRHHPDDLRNIMPNAAPYSARVRLTTIFIQGTDVDLTLDRPAMERLNAALFEHSLKTLRFPQSRLELFQFLSQNPELQSRVNGCR